MEARYVYLVAFRSRLIQIFHDVLEQVHGYITECEGIRLLGPEPQLCLFASIARPR